MFLPISMLLFNNVIVSRFSYSTFIYMNCMKSIRFVGPGVGHLFCLFCPRGGTLFVLFLLTPGHLHRKMKIYQCPGVFPARGSSQLELTDALLLEAVLHQTLCTQHVSLVSPYQRDHEDQVPPNHRQKVYKQCLE